MARMSDSPEVVGVVQPAAFEAVGFEVACRPSPERDFALERMASGTDRAQAFGQWLYEFLGWWEYRVRDWVRQ